jgi:3-deoxy-7-phosphoheptulonate synthase
MTGQEVIECTRARSITDEALADRSHTHCAPRLKAWRRLGLAFLIAEALEEQRAALRVIAPQPCSAPQWRLSGAARRL